jgi:hypothetical protein
MGRAREHVDRIRKLLFYASLWRLTARDSRFTVASLVTRRPDLFNARERKGEPGKRNHVRDVKVEP